MAWVFNPFTGGEDRELPYAREHTLMISRYLFVFIYLFVRQSCVFFQEWQLL
jgi:hypothetical protein